MCPIFGSRRRDQTRRPLQISTNRNRDSVTIALSGELDSASLDEFVRQIRDCEETEIGGIVIDLSDVSFIDSSGLAVLLDAWKRIDGRLSFLRSKHEAVKRLVAVTRTDEIFG